MGLFTSPTKSKGERDSINPFSFNKIFVPFLILKVYPSGITKGSSIIQLPALKEIIFCKSFFSIKLNLYKLSFINRKLFSNLLLLF